MNWTGVSRVGINMSPTSPFFLTIPVGRHWRHSLLLPNEGLERCCNSLGFRMSQLSTKSAATEGLIHVCYRLRRN